MEYHSFVHRAVTSSVLKVMNPKRLQERKSLQKVMEMQMHYE
jgi:hypothetical protein